MQGFSSDLDKLEGHIQTSMKLRRPMNCISKAVKKLVRVRSTIKKK